jgi:hypothetical protein
MEEASEAKARRSIFGLFVTTKVVPFQRTDLLGFSWKREDT